jgi:uncharacterized protein Yka (UPF0111/DUF47 family)
MFSLQRFFGKEDRFFGLLEASAQQARASVHAVIELSKKPTHPGSLDALVESRRKDKQITGEITEALCTTFVTALEREDIEELSIALYKIPKTVEKIGERILLSPEHLRPTDFLKHIALLEQATGIVLKMVQDLRRGLSLERMRQENEKLQTVEGEADKLILELCKDLYSGKHDPLRVIILKEIYELLEKVIDRCRDAGNVISHIVMKNS